MLSKWHHLTKEGLHQAYWWDMRVVQEVSNLQRNIDKCQGLIVSHQVVQKVGNLLVPNLSSSSCLWSDQISRMSMVYEIYLLKLQI